MKKVNAKGPDILGNLPNVRGMPAKLFKEAIKHKDNVLIRGQLRVSARGCN